jgi:UDP-3-O-[3-hydroxymyristoyl] glucosamine N-acyltransferase
MADENFFYNQGPISLADIATLSQSSLFLPAHLQPDELIYDVASLDEADNKTITVLNNAKYLPVLAKTQAKACFIEEKYASKAPKSLALLISANPYKAYALTGMAFYPQIKPQAVIAKNATIDSSAVIGENTNIEGNVVIGANVKIGKNCHIGTNTVLDQGVVIGDHTYISSNVSISYALIGKQVLIHPGVRIGQDGFGFASDFFGHYKIPQLGRVLIGNNVEIGANTCIDRGSSRDTVISDGCMIDNLVQIAHNVVLGKNCVIVAQVGIAGSTTLGDFVVVGGQGGIAGHLAIGSGAKIAAQSGVIKDIQAMSEQGGYPAMPIKQWHRQTIMLKKILKEQMKTND